MPKRNADSSDDEPDDDDDNCDEPGDDDDAPDGSDDDEPDDSSDDDEVDDDEEDYEDEDDEEYEPEEPKAKRSPKASPKSSAKTSAKSASSAAAASREIAFGGKQPMGKQPAGKATAGKAAAVASSASTSAKQAKTAAAAIAAAMPHEEIATSKELQAKAEDGGLVRSDRMPPYEYPLLHASKELRQMGAARSIDIVKKAKGAANKPRYLIALPAQLAPMDGGTIGSIERLDTPNPEIYLEWPGQGRLRLRGTLLYPKAKLITLQPRAGQLYCEEAFDNVLVFSEAGWLPPLTKSEGGGGNSAEGGGAPVRSLAAGDTSLVPIPAAVQQRIHKKWSFSAGAAAE